MDVESMLSDMCTYAGISERIKTALNDVEKASKEQKVVVALSQMRGIMWTIGLEERLGAGSKVHDTSGDLPWYKKEMLDSTVDFVGKALPKVTESFMGVEEVRKPEVVEPYVEVLDFGLGLLRMADEITLKHQKSTNCDAHVKKARIAVVDLYCATQPFVGVNK